MIENPPQTAAEAADRMSKFYTLYARTATAAGTPAVVTPGMTKTLYNAMLGLWVPKGTFAKGKQGLTTGFLGFWLAPPAAFGIGPVIGWSGQGPMNASLGKLTDLKIASSKAAKDLAASFEAATKGVMVQPPGPVPPVFVS
jgi:hypothetical protein